MCCFGLLSSGISSFEPELSLYVVHACYAPITVCHLQFGVTLPDTDCMMLLQEPTFWCGRMHYWRWVGHPSTP